MMMAMVIMIRIMMIFIYIFEVYNVEAPEMNETSNRGKQDTLNPAF